MPKEIKTGFLDSDYQSYFDLISVRYKESIVLAEEINAFAHTILKKFNDGLIHNRDIKELTTSTLFLRILESYQSVIILSKKGLISPAKMILRCMIDQVCLIVLCANNDDFLEKYIESYERDRLRAQKNIKELNIPTEYNIDDKISEIQKDIDDNKIPKLNSISLLKDSGLFEIYMGPYLLFSEAVHTTPKDLESYLTFGKDNETIKSINYGPIHTDLNRIILTAISIALDGMGAISRVFDFAINEKIEEFGTLYTSIAHKEK